METSIIYYGVFKSVIIIAFQSVFCSEIYQDNVFLALALNLEKIERLLIYYVKYTTMKILKNIEKQKSYK